MALPSATSFCIRQKGSKTLGKMNSSFKQYFAGPPTYGVA